MKQTVLLAALLGGTLLSCTKEVEVIKIQEVEKEYSWKEVYPQHLTEYAKIGLGLSKGTNGLYLQHPKGFARLTPQASGRLGVTVYQYPFPADINLRIPFSTDFFVNILGSSLIIVPTAAPTQFSAVHTTYLTSLDPLALRVRPNLYPASPFAAINRNNYLLCAYESTLGNAENKLRFVLLHVTPGTDPALPKPTVREQLITIPFTGAGFNPSYPMLITAIDDYFMVDCGQQGVYKIRQDGSYQRVISQMVQADCFYKRQNRLYMHGEYLGYSEDQGNTWRLLGTTPSTLIRNSYHQVGDSLVGIHHTLSGNFLFTSKITETSYRLRRLQDDGLTGSNITGLETWNDTVYVSTTIGLFRKPVATFFESKPE